MAGLATGLACAPAIISRKALSGAYVRIGGSSNYLPPLVLENFGKWTGINIEFWSIGSSQELFAKLRAGRPGLDIVMLPLSGLSPWRPSDLLRPWDLAKIDTGAILPPFMRAVVDYSSWGSGTFLLPYLWGSEGIGWRRDRVEIEGDGPSYGDLWREDVRGKVVVRARSGLIGMGLYLEGQGKLSGLRLRDAYRDKSVAHEAFERILDFAIEHKDWVSRFWSSSDDIFKAFRSGEAVIGQTWGGPLLAMKGENKSFMFQAPKEGALTWLDGLALMSDAENVEEAYAFANFVYQPEIGAEVANHTGYNPVGLGTEKFLSPRSAKDMFETYPGDALERLWFWPDEPDWFLELQNDYVNRYMRA
jgi:spermidine/putrescine transport system substrate-binding protein